MPAVARIACPRCELTVEEAGPTTPCPRCAGVLEAHVDLSGLRPELRDEIRRRPRGLWRWREFLPIADEASIVSLGEGDTPLIHTRWLAAETGPRAPLDQERHAAAHGLAQGPFGHGRPVARP